MKRLSILVTVVLVLAVPVIAAAAPADVSAENKAAARELFARGVAFLESGEPARAARALEQARALAPFAVVLYNLGVAYERLGQVVEASETFRAVVDEPGQLNPERVAAAQRKLATLAARIGHLAIASEPEGATVRIDGADVGTAPLDDVRLKQGTHFVEASLRGHLPDRRVVAVEGGKRATVTLTLAPTTSGLGQIWVRSPLPAAEVWLDGRQVGSTPLSSSLPVAAGTHRVELRRDGYFPAEREVQVQAGAIAEVALRPTPDEAASTRGTLALVAEEDDLLVTVDGARHGIYDGPIALPPGPHEITVERGGFEPAVLRVNIEPGETTERRALLLPTAERIADREGQRRVHAIAGWVTGGLGLVALGAGVGFTVYNEGELQSLESEFQEALDGGFCDTSTARFDEGRCNDLAERRDGRPGLRPVGYTLIGVGGAALIAGVVVLVTSPPSYAVDVDEPVFSAVQPFGGPLAEGGLMMGLGGRF